MLLVTVAVAACGSGAKGPDVAAPQPSVELPEPSPPVEEPPPGLDLTTVDACALVTKKEAEAIVGLKLNDPERGADPSRPRCRYGAPPTGPVGQVEIYVGEGAESVMAIDRQLGHKFTAVEGVGDEAFRKDHQFYFRKAEVWVLITVVRLVDPKQTRGPLEKAARNAVNRL